MQQVVKKSQPKLEYTSITALSTMDNLHPSIFLTDGTQIDDPNIGSTGRHQQA
jgi:hypothetical protein